MEWNSKGKGLKWAELSHWLGLGKGRGLERQNRKGRLLEWVGLRKGEGLRGTEWKGKGVEVGGA